jgi:hypothetical protein
MDLTPSMIGERAEAAVVHALVQAGKSLYLPFGGSSRCDVIAEDDEGLLRIQSKNGRLLGEVVKFSTCSNTKNQPKDYVGDVDAFGVYSADLGCVYLVPIYAVATRGCHLRLKPPRNNQRKGILWADDYLLARVHPPA